MFPAYHNLVFLFRPITRSRSDVSTVSRFQDVRRQEVEISARKNHQELPGALGKAEWRTSVPGSSQAGKHPGSLI